MSEVALLPTVAYHRGRLWFFVIPGDDRLYLPKEFLEHALLWVRETIHYGPKLTVPKPTIYGPFRCSTLVVYPIDFTLFTLANQPVEISIDRAWLNMMRPVLQEVAQRISEGAKYSFQLGPAPGGGIYEHSFDLNSIPPSAH
jgi:hypothetical protein